MKWIRLPYLGEKVSNNIHRILDLIIFVPHSITLTVLESFFGGFKDHIPTDERSGVYRLKCGDCNKVYIGR